jgi:isopenicillin-N N-acyltransferase-like protein
VFKIEGGPRPRGRQQGEAARAQILGSVAGYREAIPLALNLTWEAALREAHKFLPYAEEDFPEFVEELQGLAEGAGVPFEEVWAVNCSESLTEVRHQSWGCTSLAVRGSHTANGHVLLAHNEDWNSVDRDNVYLIDAEPDDGPAFLGMSYGPLLVSVGFNADGIGVAIDSAYAIDGRVGVPRILYSRAVLRARTIGQAIQACVPKRRAGGYDYLLADPHGELYGVETSATTHDLLYAEEGWLAHTNHYLSPRMQAVEEPGTYAGSNVRLNRARRLLRSQLGRVTLETLQSLLRDHVNWPGSICGHEDLTEPPHERGQTLASLIMDLTDRVMWATPGPPCEGEYVAYRLGSAD